MRRLASTLAASTVAAAGLVAASAPAQAAGTCTLNIAPNIRIASQSTRVNMSLGADCTAAGVTRATWNLYDRSGRLITKRILTKTAPSSYWLMPDSALLGANAYRWSGAGATSPSGAVSQPTRYHNVKVGSSATLAGSTRTGSSAKFIARITRYSTAQHKFIPWGGKAAVLQKSATGTGSWSNYLSMKTNASGVAVRYASDYGSWYRLVVGTETYVWGYTTGSGHFN